MSLLCRQAGCVLYPPRHRSAGCHFTNDPLQTARCCRCRYPAAPPTSGQRYSLTGAVFHRDEGETGDCQSRQKQPTQTSICFIVVWPAQRHLPSDKPLHVDLNETEITSCLESSEGNYNYWHYSKAVVFM